MEARFRSRSIRQQSDSIAQIFPPENRLFRLTMEGRFALDIVRTVLQTAIAAGVSLEDYVVHLLRAPPEDVAHRPADFTPRAFARQADSENMPAPR